VPEPYTVIIVIAVYVGDAVLRVLWRRHVLDALRAIRDSMSRDRDP
jgi:hypothetical protein